MWRWVPLMVIWAVSCAGRQHAPEAPSAVVAPIPVPQPVYPREHLSTEMQILWGRVEDAVSVRPPSPPTESNEEAIRQWAEGPFKEWLIRRQAATDRALSATYPLRQRPAYERGMGTALFGYMYEDWASSIRGAPVPEDIAEDEGLLQIYSSALDEHLTPLAELSARAYYACVALFVKYGDSQWVDWADYCDQRGAEVVETFKLEPPEPEETNEAAIIPPESPDAGTSSPGMDGAALDSGTPSP